MKAPPGQQPGSLPEGLQNTIYALALAVSISTSFIVFRAPLWLDETVSMYLIKGGWGRASDDFMQSRVRATDSLSSLAAPTFSVGALVEAWR
jgi:hypothetical protein